MIRVSAVCEVPPVRGGPICGKPAIGTAAGIAVCWDHGRRFVLDEGW